MNTTLPPPTAEVARLVDMIGAEAALALVEAHGGTDIYIPKKPTVWLLDLMGEKAAMTLCAAHTGSRLKVPLARHWRALIYREQGLSRAAIARKVGCSEDTIQRILHDNGKTRQQLDLFAE